MVFCLLSPYAKSRAHVWALWPKSIGVHDWQLICPYSKYVIVMRFFILCLKNNDRTLDDLWTSKQKKYPTTTIIMSYCYDTNLVVPGQIIFEVSLPSLQPTLHHLMTVNLLFIIPFQHMTLWAYNRKQLTHFTLWYQLHILVLHLYTHFFIWCPLSLT